MANGERFRSLQIRQSYFRQDIRPFEYVIAILKIMGLLAMISYLFYESWIAFLVLMPVGVWLLLRWERGAIEKKEREFAVQFKEALQSIAMSLRVGYSMENAMIEAKKDLAMLYPEDSAIQREFTLMIREIYLQIPMERIMEEWACRVKQEEVRNFVNVFVMARKSGGNMIGIMKSSIAQIREKMEVQAEIDTLLAARKYEFKVMTAIPFGMIAYMKISFSEFMGLLYGNGIGIGVMTGCLGAYFAAYMIGEKIVHIEI